ncbi:metallophosphoesterase [Clostridiaceae bacterium M8S5]|nr:metallophosphoesterase [Clostridiaceae bacterium M8S5]
MKIIVVSDTHGATHKVTSLLSKLEGIDLVIHLGDYLKDMVKIENTTKIKNIKIKGNCDLFSANFEEIEEKVIKLKDKKFLLTHGHRYSVKNGLGNLYYRAKELDVDVVLFGHSHISYNEVHDDILFLNPGSPSIPKGGTKASVALITIDDIITSDIIELEDYNI